MQNFINTLLSGMNITVRIPQVIWLFTCVSLMSRRRHRKPPGRTTKRMKTTTTLFASVGLTAGLLLLMNSSVAADRSENVVEKSEKLFEEAEVDLHGRLTIVEADEGDYSPSLVSILQRLGNLYYHARRFPEALAVLRRAQHITHRNDGVYTLDQLNVVKGISAIHQKTNQFQAVDSQERFHYKINEYNFGADDERMIPVLTRLGNWFRRSGQYDDALKAYRKSVSLLERHGSDTELELIAPLKAISSVLYLQGSCCAVEPLDRAYDIVVNDRAADLGDKFRALIELADMSLLESDRDKATKLYGRAWEMQESESGNEDTNRFSAPARLAVSGADDVVNAFRQARDGYRSARMMRAVLYVDDYIDDHVAKAETSQDAAITAGRSPPKQADKLIGSPLPLCYPQLLDLVVDKSANSFEDYFMDLDFTVNKNGQVLAVNIVDSNTPMRLGKYVMFMLEKTRFRPRISNGLPVSTDHIRLHQTFTGDMDSHRQSPFEFESKAIFHGCQMLTAFNG